MDFRNEKCGVKFQTLISALVRLHLSPYYFRAFIQELKWTPKRKFIYL